MSATPSRGRARLRQTIALCRKETLQIVRDPSSVLIAFVLPVVMLFLFGYAINLDTARTRVGVVLLDDGPDAADFLAAFAGSSHIAARVAHDVPTMDRALAAGEVRGYVVIQPDFGPRARRAGGDAPVLIITDGSEPNTASFVEQTARGAWATWLRARTAAQGRVPSEGAITIAPRYWFNPSTESRHQIVPGSIAIVMTVISVFLTSLVVARERERGTLEALWSTSITRGQMLVSKFVPYFVLGLGSMVLCVVIATAVMHVPFRGAWSVLLAMTAAFMLSGLGLGLLISTTQSSQFNAAQLALNLAFLPSVMLSGSIYEIASMPPVLRALTAVVPARYFVSALQTLFQAGVIADIVWRDLVFLLIAGTVFMGLTVVRTRRTLD